MTYVTSPLGDEFESIMDALYGILMQAIEEGADESDCASVSDEIVNDILSTPYSTKKLLADGGYVVRIDGGFLDVGYLLSERF